TEQCKYRVWGVATQNAPRAVYPWKPILFRSYVTASFMGIINDGRTRFDERFNVKEDYELNLRCIKEDGGIIAARYIHWTNSHWTDAGGCAAYRTQLMELRCIKLLMQLYPGMIRRVRRGGSCNLSTRGCRGRGAGNTTRGLAPSGISATSRKPSSSAAPATMTGARH